MRLDASLTAADSPEISFPSSEAEIWPVKFSDGVATVFTPQRRYVANDESPAVRVGYRIMATVARQIGEMARKSNVPVIFTIIPTKELVYAPKVVKEKIVPPSSYPPLVNSEQKHLLQLAEQLSAIPDTTSVDILRPLQKAALMNVALYPTNNNGHPDYLGYLEIARSLMATAKNSLPDKLHGGVELTIDSGAEEPLLYKGLIKNDFLYIFASDEVFWKNGWEQKDLLKISSRDIANIRFGGSVSMIAPLIFGPNK